MQGKSASEESLVKFKKCILFLNILDEVFPVLGDLELITKPRLALNLKQSCYLSLPNVGITGTHYYT